MREELGAALNPEMAVQRGHVLVRGGRAQAEAGGDLLLTVAFGGLGNLPRVSP
jgi:hypothetical protein